MATFGPQDFCSLCLCCKLIKIETLQKKEMLKKISKYLLIKMEQNSVALCANCYNSLEDFHKFYEGVHSAQKNFHLIQTGGGQTFEAESLSTRTRNLRKEEEEESSVDEISNNVNKGFYEVLDSGKTEANEDVVLGDIQLNTLNCKSEIEKVVKKEKQGKQVEISDDMEKRMIEFYNVKCDRCEDIKFSSFKMLSRHYTNVHNSQGYIKCCKRNIRVNDKSYLKSHMLKHLEPDSCRCAVCGKQLSSPVTLKHHMILHKPVEERPFQCRECNKRFCCKNDLKNHEKAIHVPENEREDFICDVCGKVFQKVANLRYHHSTVHLQERKYVCELCAKCFTTPSGLRTHRNAAHSTRGPIQCQECNKWLKNEDTFQKHLQLHQNNSYPCSQCSKICNSSTSLRSHMVKHSDERPYMCKICQKSFKTKTHLKNHFIQHSGGSNYKCPFCSKTFVNMSNYYTHRKRMHLNQDSVKHASRDAKEEELEEEESQIDSRNLNVKNVENNFDYNYKFMAGSGSRAQLSENNVPVVRQNIIVSPVNLKYL